MNPLEINELQKAMMLRGVDYETSELIIQEFRARCVQLLGGERYHEITQAEREGRLVILPCKVDDDLFITQPRFYNYEKHEGVQHGKCKKYELDEERGWEVWIELDGGSPHTLYAYGFEDFGKTVFLSRSEAEKALEETK